MKKNWLDKLKRWKTAGVVAAVLAFAGAGLRLASASALTSASHEVQPYGFTSGGSTGLTSTSHEMGMAVGGVSQSTFSSSGYQLQSGFMSLMSWPDRITDLATIANTSTTITLSWSAPGYNGDLGSLPFGTSYYIQASTDIGGPWTVASAQVVIATGNVAAGTPQTAVVPNLMPNSTYYFRLWAVDPSGNAAEESNDDAVEMTLAKDVVALPNTFLNVYQSSITAAWAALAPAPDSATASGYVLQASAQPDFSILILSSSTTNIALSTLTVSGLVAGTDYFFRVGTRNKKGALNYTVIGSTKTKVSEDGIPPDGVADLVATVGGDGQLRLDWTAPFDPTDDPLNGNYAIQYATWTGVDWSTSNAQVAFSTSNVTAGTAQSRLVNGLDPNTTYYLKIWTADLGGNWSVESNQADQMTRSLAPTGIDVSWIGASSATLHWDAFAVSPDSNTSLGHRLEAATDAGFTSIVASSETLNVLESALTVTGLDPNTIYFFRAAGRNFKGVWNYGSAISSSTLANAPSRLATDALMIGVTSATIRWAALPTAPTSLTASGYRLDVSSVNFTDPELTISSVTANVLSTTLTVTGLLPYTTYAYRVGSLNTLGAAHFTQLDPRSTLTEQPGAATALTVSTGSVSVSWSAPVSGASGYRLEGSTTNFNGSGTIVSSTTADGLVTTLTVSGLPAHTTTYLRVGALTWEGAAHYGTTIATATLANAPARLSSDFIDLYETSATVRWAAMPASPQDLSTQGYRLEASASNFSGGAVLSSATTLINVSTLTVTGLDVNTTYYFRVGSINWNQLPNYATLDSTSTRARAPLSAASTFTLVEITSVSVQWNTNLNPAWTNYLVQLATSAGFTGNLSSATATATPAWVTGLTPNTTYSARVTAMNNNNFFTSATSLGSTVTRANVPGIAGTTYDPIYTSSFTIHFTSGTPANPVGTFYEVQVSSMVDYSTALTSVTANTNATYPTLLINTTYYSRIRARNHAGWYSDYLTPDPGVTLAVPAVSSFYSNVTHNSLTVNWASGTVSTGYNPADTAYQVQVSLVSNFFTTIYDVVTTDVNGTFGSLIPNTAYYARVRAISHAGVATPYESLGSTTTLVSATPTFLAGTFEVANAEGVYQDPSFYTNTTTPSVRVRVHSTASPGLAVQDVPAMKTIWHADEPSGSIVYDASRHNFNMTLAGANPPTRVAGVIGSGLKHSGAAGYAVSGALSGFRSNAANNVFTVEFWFKANSSEDQGMVFSNSTANTGGTNTGTADNQFGWTGGNFVWRLENTGNTGSNLSAGAAYDDNQWHYVAGVLNASGRFLYIDGVLANSDALRTSANAETYTTIYSYLGTGTRLDGFAVTNYYAGAVDEVRISTVAYDEDQIWENYQLGKTLGHGFGGNVVDISTQAGTNFTWVRASTNAVSISGANGSTTPETFTSSLTFSGYTLRETASPGANTNRIAFFTSAMNGGWDSEVYTVLVDTTAPSVPAMSSLDSISTTAVTASWNATTDALSGLASAPYTIEASTSSTTFFPKSTSGLISPTSHEFTGLMPNTTYYFRVQANDAAGNASAFSTQMATMTLSNPIQNVAVQAVYFTSATYGWTALPITPSSSSAYGYRLEASSSNFESGSVVRSSESIGVVMSTLTVSNLLPNTTYSFRVASLNALRAANYTLAAGTATRANPVDSASVQAIHVTSATVSWSLPTGGAEGFRLEASPTSDFSGAVPSSSTTNTATLALTIEALDPNTTYYFRVGALNKENVMTYAGAGSTSTLALAVTRIDPDALVVNTGSVTMRWTALPAAPMSETSEGYRLESSSTNFNGWGTVFVSSTSLVNNSTLTVMGLSPNIIYAFRVGTLNWNDIPHYVSLSPTSTLTDKPASPVFTNVYVSSLVVTWGLPPSGAEGYRVEASTASDFSGNLLSIDTDDDGATTLTLESLLSNTTYYVRAGAANWDGAYNYAEMGSTKTKASIDLVAPDGIDDLNAATLSDTSVLLTWLAPADATDNPLSGNYLIQHATSTGVSWSHLSAQVNIATSGVTSDQAQYAVVTDLDPNSTHYFRIWTQDTKPNLSPISNGATVATLAKAPQDLQTTDVWESSVTLSWTAFPPSPSSATSFGYSIQVATMPDFTGTVSTMLLGDVNQSSETVTGLDRNTSYYFRLGSRNWVDARNYSTSAGTATLAAQPERLATDFLAIYITSVTVRWKALPDAPQSARSEGYRVEASSTDFDGTGTILSSQTTSVTVSTLTISGLEINTTYYFRVGSLNLLGAISMTSLNSTSTLAEVPAAADPVYSGVSNTALTLNWVANGNGSATLYEAEIATASNFTGNISSAMTSSLSNAFSNLSPNTTYYGRVRAVNHNSIPTAYADLGSTVTLAGTPAGAPLVFNPVHLSSLTVNFTVGSPANPTGTLYQVDVSSLVDYSSVVTSVTANSYADFTGLELNTTYYARIRGVNHLGTFTAYEDLGSTATLATAPTPDPDPFTSVTYSNITFRWLNGTGDPGFNPDDTTYHAQISLVSNFATILSETYVDIMEAGFSGLTSNTQYYLRVRALNRFSIPTAFLSIGSTTTLVSATPSFLTGTFEVSNAQGVYRDGALYTNITTPTVRAQVHSNASPGLAVTDVPGMKTIWHLDEPSGATAFDASRHNFNLTLAGASPPTRVDGQVGSGLKHSGAAGYAVSGALSGFRSNAANNVFTIEFWFKAASNEDQGHIFSNSTVNTGATASGTADNQFGWVGSNLVWRLETTANAGSNLSSGQNYADDQWHYVAGVLNAAGRFLYVDGSLVASDNLRTSANSETYATVYSYVGTATRLDGFAVTNYYAGAVDEVRISTVAYDEDQIWNNYQLGLAGHGFGANVVDISTQSGANFTWVRGSTDAIAVSGAAGTTSVQTFTSSISLSGYSLRETESPGAPTNRIRLFSSAVDASMASSVYTVLIDTTVPGAPTISALASITTTTITASWSGATDALSGLAAAPYTVDASTSSTTFFPKITSGLITPTSHEFTGLLPNTTYFVQVNAKDAAENTSAFSAQVSTMTLATPVENQVIQAVYFTSATLAWTAHPASPSSSTAGGYRVEASSTGFDGSGVVLSSESVGVGISALTVNSLLPNTTYTFRVAAFNFLHVPNYAADISTATRANAVGTPAISEIHITSAAIAWSTPSGGATGFRLEASTAANFSGNVLSSVTTNTGTTGLTIINLDPNTTYHFRVGAVNWNNVITYAAAGSTATRTNEPSDIALESVFISSLTIGWSGTTGGSSGYRAEASTAADFSGDVKMSSTSDSGSLSLIVFGLDANTTYYIRAGSLNQNQVPAYGDTVSALTRANSPTGLTLADILVSSITATWSGMSGSFVSYRLEASTAADFTGDLSLSSTTDTGALSLSVIGLDANTTYHVRLGAVNSNGDASYTAPLTTSTLAAFITRHVPDELAVFPGSATVRWHALAAVPQSATSEGYRLEASSTNFEGSEVSMSSTTDVALSTLTISGLDANTTYYFRAGALNWNGVPNYVSLTATSTLAGVPTSTQFNAVHVSSIIVTWSVPPFGAEGYRLDASSSSEDFSVVDHATATANGAATSLTLLGLDPDTTYYVRVGALNWNGVVNYAYVGSTITRTSIDPVGPDAVNDLDAVVLSTTAMRLSWSAPLDTTDNPFSGKYFIQFSSWTGVVWSTVNAQIEISTLSVTAGTLQAHVIEGLMPNTTYYSRLWTQDVRPNTSPISNGATVATLADAPVNPTLVAIHETSATVAWTGFPVSPSSSSVQGLRLEASTSDTFSSVISSLTRVAAADSLTVSGLDRNTTYFFRVVSLNWADASNASVSFSTSTLARAPATLSSSFLTVGANSLAIRWAALPAAPMAETSEGYRLEVSSVGFTGTNAAVSSATALSYVSTLTASGLSANVTYYARVASLNWNGVLNFTALGATSTLANVPVSAVSTFTSVTNTEITAAWLDAGNSINTLYQLDLSTMSNFSGTVLSSATQNLSATIISLSVGTTYFARVRAINHNEIPTAYLALGSTVTRATLPGAAAVVFDPVHITSFTVNITSGTPANPAGTRYQIDQSTDENFSVFSTSETLALSATFSGLAPNTTYFARVRSLNSAGDPSDYTALGATATLAVQPGPAVTTFTAIGNRVFTLNWSEGVGPDVNPAGTTYRAEISLAPTYTSPIEIVTDQLNATFSSLAFGTTYYARVRAQNHQGILTDFVAYGDVTTLPSSQPEFVVGTFEVTDSASSWIDGTLYTDTTTVDARVQVESRFAPGLAITHTDSDLAFWRFEEGSGSTVDDSSHRSNTLTLKGAPLPTWTSGHLESGVDFDGSQNHATSGTLYPWRAAADKNAWTVQLWFKSSANVGYLFQAANKNTGIPSSFDLDLGWHNTSGNLSFALRTSGGIQKIAESGQSYADGNWHSVAAVLDGSAMRLYVDGSQVGVNTDISAANARTYGTEIYAWIGGAALLDSNIGNGSKFTTATIDEVRLSTVAFDADRILADHELGAAGIPVGGPAVYLSTQSGADFTWSLVTSTALTGSDGTTSAQTFTANDLTVFEGAASNQLKVVITSLDGNQAIETYAIQVDTTAPAPASIQSFAAVTSTHFAVQVTGATDATSGLHATPYRIEVSSRSDFNPIAADSGYIASTDHLFTGLLPDTTYFARSYVRDAAGRIAGPSISAEAAPALYRLELSTDAISIPELINLNTTVVISTPIVVTNTGNVTSTFRFSATTTTVGSPWVVDTAQAIDRIVIWGVISSTQPASGDFTVDDIITETGITATSTVLSAGDSTGIAVPAGETRTLWIKIGMPTLTNTGDPQDIRIRGTAVVPD